MLCAEELVSMVNAISIGMSQGRNAEELAFLSSVLSLIASTLSTIAVQREWMEDLTDETPIDVE